MLDITPDIQEDMGSGNILVDGDSLYINADEWAIFVPGADRYINAEILDILRRVYDSVERSQIDWRLLCPAEIDLERETFIPMLSRKPVPIVSRAWYSTTSVEEVRKHLNSWGVRPGERTVDVSAAFLGGDFYPSYPRSTQEGSVTVALRKDRAVHYVYNHDGLAFAMHGGILRGIHKLGFHLEAPLRRPNGRFLSFGVLDECDITCTVKSTGRTGIATSADGRSLYVDPGLLCWETPEKGMEIISKNTSFFDPKNAPELRMEDRIEETFDREIKEAVSILRWHLVPEQKIIDALEERQPYALTDLYDKYMQTTQELYDSLLGIDSLCNLGYIESRVRALCHSVERLQDHMGELDLGDLPELVQLLESKKRSA